MSSSDAARNLRVRAWLAATLLALTVGGCGFQLRGQAAYKFQTIYVQSPAGSFATELRRWLEGSGSAALVDTAAQAEVVLDIELIANDKAVLSLSSGGRAREFALAKRVQFKLRDKDGNDWLPTDVIVIRRTFLYDDSERLAREIQEQRLDKEMQTDAIQQIVRRLQVARKPA
jgi:LPS-assembly lipoprotein